MCTTALAEFRQKKGKKLKVTSGYKEEGSQLIPKEKRTFSFSVRTNKQEKKHTCGSERKKKSKKREEKKTVVERWNCPT